MLHRSFSTLSRQWFIRLHPWRDNMSISKTWPFQIQRKQPLTQSLPHLPCQLHNLQKIYEDCKFLVKFHRVPLYTPIFYFLVHQWKPRSLAYWWAENRLYSPTRVLYEYLGFQYKVELQNHISNKQVNQKKITSLYYPQQSTALFQIISLYSLVSLPQTCQWCQKHYCTIISKCIFPSHNHSFVIVVI